MIGDNNLKSKKLFYSALFLIFIFFSLIVFHQSILDGAGRFLAPSSNEGAEVVILEGTQILTNGTLSAGMKLLSDGRAKSIVVVLHHPLKENQAFALVKLWGR